MLSKIAYWLVWTALTAVVLVLVYRNTDWFKPAADKAVDSVKSVVSKVPTGPFGKDTTNDKLTSAREAFAAGDIDRAVASYNEVIKSNANNADARGELGNVYYLTGQLPQAAQAYYDAANLLLDRKEFDRVEPLLPVIAQINPMMVDELIQKLHMAMDASMMPPQAQGQYLQQSPQSALTRH
jgi:tetratricopeptide (TPR) repeat protein